MLAHQGLGGGAGERGLSREHLVQHAGERVEIAPAVEVLLAGGLLRAHIGRRPDRHPRPGERLAAGGTHRLGDPEVRHHRVAALEQDVLRLDVAVDDAPAVRVAQRVGHLAGDPKRVVHRELLFAGQPVAEGLSLDERHHVEQEIIRPPVRPLS